MRSWSVLYASGRRPRHFATRLEARAALIRAGDPGAFVGCLSQIDHDVLTADGARVLALRVLGRAAEVPCAAHHAGPSEPCADHPGRLCADRLASVGLIAFTYAPCVAVPAQAALDLASYPLETAEIDWSRHG